MIKISFIRKCNYEFSRKKYENCRLRKKGFEPKIYLPEAHFVDSSPQSAQTDSAGASGEYFRMPDEAILEIMT